jgi:hypothetical protein
MPRKTNGVIQKSTKVADKSNYPLVDQRLMEEFESGRVGDNLFVVERKEWQTIKKGGQVYDDNSHPKLAFRICSQTGATAEQLAQIFGVTERTLSYWQIRYPRFCNAFRLGKDLFDTQIVENHMLKRALGYTVTVRECVRQTKIVKGKGSLPEYDENGEVKTYVEETELTKDVHIPGSEKLIITWMTNRNPKRWSKNPQPLEIEGNERHIDLSKLSEKELEDLQKISSKVVKDIEITKKKKASITDKDREDAIEVIPDILEEMVDIDA